MKELVGIFAITIPIVALSANCSGNANAGSSSGTDPQSSQQRASQQRPPQDRAPEQRAPQQRALSLDVKEDGDRVEVELIAHSSVTQQVQYEIELTGNSHAHHTGNTQIEAGRRHMLSRLVSNGSANWCAKVDVSEGSGAQYTLSAGDCG